MKTLSSSIQAVMMMAAAAMAADVSLEQKEQFLLTARVVEQKGLSMGVTNSSKATMADGTLTHAAHVQTINESKSTYTTVRGTELNFRDSYKYNVAAYELAKMLDLTHMVPPSVERRISGNQAALTWWVDDVQMTELDRFKKKLSAPDQNRWNKQMNVVHAFDQLIYNTDRNLGNLVITNQWDIWMIDHTRAFRMASKCNNLKMVRHIDRELLEKMRALDAKAVYSRLSKYLTKPEISGLLARRDELVRYIDGMISERGEEAVLFSANVR